MSSEANDTNQERDFRMFVRQVGHSFGRFQQILDEEYKSKQRQKDYPVTGLIVICKHCDTLINAEHGYAIKGAGD